jgi:hypothetical protein
MLNESENYKLFSVCKRIKKEDLFVYTFPIIAYFHPKALENIKY